MNAKLAQLKLVLDNAKAELRIQLPEIQAVCEHPRVHEAPFFKDVILGGEMPVRICEECRLEEHGETVRGGWRKMPDTEGRAVHIIEHGMLRHLRVLV